MEVLPFDLEGEGELVARSSCANFFIPGVRTRDNLQLSFFEWPSM